MKIGQESPNIFLDFSNSVDYPSNMPNQSLVLPDEIPDETVPLADGEFVPAPPFRGDMIRDLNSKNVFVSFKDGTTAVGRLSCETRVFYVGGDDTLHYYTDIDSFREV